MTIFLYIFRQKADVTRHICFSLFDFTFKPFLNGGIVDVPSQNWDAICHDGSYGNKDGLLEVMGRAVNRNLYDDVEGYLTADEILKRVDENEGD